MGSSVRMEKEGFVRLSQTDTRGFRSFYGRKDQILFTILTHGIWAKVLIRACILLCFFVHVNYNAAVVAFWWTLLGIGKKLDELGKKKETKEVAIWRKSIVNHLYWSASTSSSGDEAVARWSSVINHVQNVHTHKNALFPHCLHQLLFGDNARVWLKPSKCDDYITLLLLNINNYTFPLNIQY